MYYKLKFTIVIINRSNFQKKDDMFDQISNF